MPNSEFDRMTGIDLRLGKYLFADSDQLNCSSSAPWVQPTSSPGESPTGWWQSGLCQLCFYVLKSAWMNPFPRQAEAAGRYCNGIRVEVPYRWCFMIFKLSTIPRRMASNGLSHVFHIFQMGPLTTNEVNNEPSNATALKSSVPWWPMGRFLGWGHNPQVWLALFPLSILKRHKRAITSYIIPMKFEWNCFPGGEITAADFPINLP